MNLRKLLTLAGLLLLVGASSVFGGTVLWWTDVDAGTDAIPGAITLAGMTGTQATDPVDFATKLGLGGWNVVIFGEQANAVFNGSVQTALTTYLAGGGRIIGATWLSTPFAGFMQATEVGQNGTTITTSGNPIFAGLGGTISITNPGWGVYDQCYTPTGGATGIGSLDCGGSAVILGNSGRTYLNSPLFDAYATTADGQRLIANEISALATATPEPATFMLAGWALAGLCLISRRKPVQNWYRSAN